MAQKVKNLPAMQETWARSLDWENPLATRKELGLRIAQSSVTAQSQLVGNLRPRQDRRNQVSPWLPRDLRETQTAGQGDRRTSQAITRKTQRLCQGTGPPPSRDPTAGRSLGWEDPWRREQLPTPVFLPGKSHEQRNLVGYSPRGCKELDTTEQLHFHFQGFPGGASGKVPACQCRRRKRC